MAKGFLSLLVLFASVSGLAQDGNVEYKYMDIFDYIEVMADAPVSNMSQSQLMCVDDLGSRDCYLDIWQGKKVNVLQAFSILSDNEKKIAALNDEEMFRSIFPAYFVSSEYVDRLKEVFEVVSVRKLGLKDHFLTTNESKQKVVVVPFTVSVFWKSTELGLNATVVATGKLELPFSEDQALVSDEEHSDGSLGLLYSVLNPKFEKVLDSDTENNLEMAGKFLENAARSMVFDKIKSDTNDSIDETTMEFMEQIAGAVIMGDLLGLPVLKSILMEEKRYESIAIDDVILQKQH